MNESSSRKCSTIRVIAPSNIALVKYWGKKDGQIPCNPSISFTLTKATTTTSLDVEVGKFCVEFYFEQVRNPKFEEKVERYLVTLCKEYPELANYRYKFYSENSFPHSCGIASSASAFASIAMIVSQLLKKDGDLSFVSALARRGSGSAARSIYGGAVLWGELENIGSPSFANSLDLHPFFYGINDSIFMINSGEKEVSSSAGHELMNNHPYKDQRFLIATKRASLMKNVLAYGDEVDFISIVESEALDLHAMMMTSERPFLLFSPLSIEFIKKIWKFRKESGLFLAFTLDAGPNIHLFWHERDKVALTPFLKELSSLVGGKVLFDKLSLTGPNFL